MTGIEFSFPWEISLMTAIQAHFNQFGVLISQFCSLLGQEYPLVLFVCVFYFIFDKQRGKRILFSLLAVLTWCPMIKNLTFRRRPYFDHPEIKILLNADPMSDAFDLEAQGFSFPSAHSACSMAAYPTIFGGSKKKWVRVLGYILPLIVGISRFCVGAHYPTDVLAGWLLGLAVLFLITFFSSRLKNENYLYIGILITSIPGLFYCQTSDYFSGFGLLLGSVFAVMFEAKYVNFERVKSVKYGILRVVLGVAVFLLFGQGLKYIIGPGLIARVVRYSIGAFITLGIFPICFKKFEKERN